MKDLENAKTCQNCRHEENGINEYPCKDRHIVYGECDRWEEREDE